MKGKIIAKIVVTLLISTAVLPVMGNMSIGINQVEAKINSNMQSSICGFESKIVIADRDDIMYVYNKNKQLCYPSFDVDFTKRDGLACGDVDGDKVDEIVVADRGNFIYIFELDGSDSRSFKVDFAENDGLECGDVNGDGIDEIIHGDRGNWIRIYAQDGSLPPDCNDFQLNFEEKDGLACGDVDGDGKDEIIHADRGNWIYMYNEYGEPNDNTLERFWVDFTQWDGFACGDVDGDGKDEIIHADRGNYIYIYNEHGELNNPNRRRYWVDFEKRDGLSCGDVDGDGIEEIVHADRDDEIHFYNQHGRASGIPSFQFNFEQWDGFDCTDIPDDEDGLPLSWEVHGYDHDGDGSIDVDLPAMGANPYHKDIFVEIDYMQLDPPDPNAHTHRPRARAMQGIVDSFNNAPVQNPDETTGIHLHIDYDPGAPLTWNPQTPRWGSLSDADALPHQQQLGSNHWNAFNTIRSNNFEQAREPIFHYNLWCNKVETGDNILGLAYSGTSYFIVSLGGLSPNDVGTVNHQMGVFMHELGHTLGLGHGGNEGMNFKPNYLSVMNYAFAIPGLRIYGSDGHYDYSRFELKELKEYDLNERLGIEIEDEFAHEALGYGTRFFDPTGRMQVVDNIFGPIDWDMDGNNLETSVVVNINRDWDNPPTNTLPKITDLTGFDDWDNINYEQGPIGPPSPGPPSDTVDIEVITEDAKNIPMDYSVCINGPSFVEHTIGTVKEYNYKITNIGERDDTYNIEFITREGIVDISNFPTSVMVESGMSKNFSITVSVPSGVSDDDYEELITINVTSNSNPLILDAAETTVNFIYSYPYFDIIQPRDGLYIRDKKLLSLPSMISGLPFSIVGGDLTIQVKVPSPFEISYVKYEISSFRTGMEEYWDYTPPYDLKWNDPPGLYAIAAASFDSDEDFEGDIVSVLKLW